LLLQERGLLGRCQLQETLLVRMAGSANALQPEVAVVRKTGEAVQVNEIDEDIGARRRSTGIWKYSGQSAKQRIDHMKA